MHSPSRGGQPASLPIAVVCCWLQGRQQAAAGGGVGVWPELLREREVRSEWHKARVPRVRARAHVRVNARSVCVWCVRVCACAQARSVCVGGVGV